MSRKVRSVSFNLNDPFEKKMFKHSQDLPDFSNFIKKLYLSYLNVQPNTQPQNNLSNEPPMPPVEQPTVNLNHLRQLI